MSDADRFVWDEGDVMIEPPLPGTVQPEPEEVDEEEEEPGDDDESAPA